MRFLVIDEHPLLREALENVLKRQFPAAEIDCVDSHAEARERLLREPADLIVTDLLCGTPADLQSLPELVRATAPGRVVVFGKCAGESAKRVQAAGVHGYVPATARPELISAAIGLVMAGGVYFPQLPRLDRRSGGESDRQIAERLSSRQREVLRGLQAGQSNKAIARELGLSVATVKLHVQSILRHAGARNRTEAVALIADQLDEVGA
jgi:DNA-binding NarL/FixJ family response regulator